MLSPKKISIELKRVLQHCKITREQSWLFSVGERFRKEMMFRLSFKCSVGVCQAEKRHST